MQFRILGNTGLKVSFLCLGAGTIGSRWGRHWTMSEDECSAVLDLALDSGINFIDTANVYNAGESEAWLGKMLKSRRGVRDSIVLATKFGYRNSAADPNSGGSSRRAMFAAVEDSLRRLQSDYIDIYYLHLWDAITPVDQTMAAAADLVASGKVRYIGLSNVPGWYFGQAETWCRLLGKPVLAAVQMHYNLLERSVEHELLPCAINGGIGLVAWGPLANGLLAGRYCVNAQERTLTGAGRLTETFGTGDIDPFADPVPAVLDGLVALSETSRHTPAELSLAWLLRKPGVSSVAVGVSSAAQLTANLRATQIELSDETMSVLNQLTAPQRPYPHNMQQYAFQELVHGADNLASLDPPPRWIRVD